MKQYLVQFTALVLLALTVSTDAQLKAMKIKLDLIDKLIDGKAGLNPVELIELQDGIQSMRKGQNGHDGQSYLISFEGKRHSLKQLVELEKKGTAKKSSQAYKTALAEAHKKVQNVTSKYMRKARLFKATLVKIIEQWALQRNLPNTLLKEWSRQGEGHELKQLQTLATTFAKLDEFLTHLSIFLIDFRESCPKTFGKSSPKPDQAAKKPQPKKEL